MQNCTSNESFAHIVIPAKAVTGTLYAVSIIFPNLIVVILVCHTTFVQRQDSVPRMLMTGLCVTDLGFGVFNCIPQVVNYWAGYCAAGGHRTCLYLGYMQTFFLKSSHLIVVLMSLERATALTLPFRYPKLWTIKSTLLAKLVVFVYANIIAILPFIGVNEYGYRSFCWFTWDDSSQLGSLYVYYYAVEGLVLSVVVVICNIAVVRELVRMRKSSNGAGVLSSVKPEFLVLMVSVSVLFIICTTPVLIRMLCVQLGIGISAEADFLAMRFFITNSAINAHMYWVLRLVVGKKLLTKAKNAFLTMVRRRSPTVDVLDSVESRDKGNSQISTIMTQSQTR